MKMLQQQIRQDLKKIKEYFHYYEMIKRAVRDNTVIQMEQLVKKYIQIIKNAPKRLSDVFYGLYVGDKTQKKLSQEWNVTEKYIQILNKRLIVWLEQAITQEQKQ